MVKLFEHVLKRSATGALFFLALSLALTGALTGATWADGAGEAGGPVNPRLEEVGGARGLYLRLCAQCHGTGGKGDGINSTPDMTIDPRDHTDPLFMSTRTDEQLAHAIRDGGTKVGKSPIMPAWRYTITEDEVQGLVAYLREICKCIYVGVISDEKLRRIDPEFR